MLQDTLTVLMAGTSESNDKSIVIILWIILAAIGATVLGSFILAVWPAVFMRGYSPAGDRPSDGLVIFIEGIRWLNFPWDKHVLLAGLRQAGFRGDFEYSRWHETWRALLVLPVIADRVLLKTTARRLAERVEAETAKGRQVYLIGSSAGGYLVMRALELLSDGVKVPSAAVLAGAVDYRRDLSAALEHVRDSLVVTASRGDWLILGLLTIIGGTADRKHVPSMGMLGPRRPANDSRLRVIRYGRKTIGDWIVGGHFTTAAMVRKWIAPSMELTTGHTNRQSSLENRQ